MNDNVNDMNNIDDKKSKIRERYKGVDSDALDVIPAIPQEDFYHTSSSKRVAVYARVSTDDPRQTSSYELQKNHYTDMVSRRDDWNLVEIYADEGISGTSLQHRDAFINEVYFKLRNRLTPEEQGMLDLAFTLYQNSSDELAKEALYKGYLLGKTNIMVLEDQLKC